MSFEAWIKKIFSGQIPTDVIAFNFNLYEDEIENQYDVELVACKNYDSENDDWACFPAFSSGEDELYVFSADGWDKALYLFIQLVKDYLRSCSTPNPLTRAEYITAGFVDGDLHVISL